MEEQFWRQSDADEFESVEEVAAKLVKVVETVEPDEDLTEKYEECYQKFRIKLPALKPVFRKIVS